MKLTEIFSSSGPGILKSKSRNGLKFGTCGGSERIMSIGIEGP